MSDALLTECPECKKATFSKMVTAAGFQLKGGGWYVTDFKGGNTTPSASKKTEEKQTDSGSKTESADTAKSEKPKTEIAAAPSTPAASSNTTGS